MVEELQPFKGCEWTRQLRDLSNPDKHRTLTSVIRKFEGSFTASKEELEPLPGRPGRFQVKMRNASAKVTFWDGASVLETLYELTKNVGMVLQDFQGIFGEADTFDVRPSEGGAS